MSAAPVRFAILGFGLHAVRRLVPAFLQCERRLLAQSGRAGQRVPRQLLGVKRTLAAPQLAGFLACKASTAEDSFVD